MYYQLLLSGNGEHYPIVGEVNHKGEGTTEITIIHIFKNTKLNLYFTAFPQCSSST